MSGTIVSAGMPRILAIGQRREVLDAVIDEVTSCGFRAEGVPLAAAFDGIAGEFDIVSFGAGVPAEARRLLEQQFRRRRPGTRFLRTYAPYAASQIVAAARQMGPSPSVDLDAYCRRIGYAGPLDPTIEILRALQEHHIAAIPFEAIDVLLDRGIDISPGAVDAKLIGARRGGYCFEQNALFKRVLGAIGFHVDALVARVRWRAEPGAPPNAPSHMALRVESDGGEWLVDVGFGANVPPMPLRLDISDEQPSRHETYRLIQFGSGFLLQMLVNGRWQPLYDLSPEPLLDSHYEPFNWFTSTHPNSHFRRELIVARTTPQARYALLDNRLTVRGQDEAERHYLSANDIEHALGEIFGFEVEESWRPLIERCSQVHT